MNMQPLFRQNKYFYQELNTFLLIKCSDQLFLEFFNLNSVFLAKCDLQEMSCSNRIYKDISLAWNWLLRLKDLQ